VVKIEGIYPTLLTPMRNGAIDWESYQRMLDYMGDYVDGYCVGGSVGEAASLTLEERVNLIKQVSKMRKPDKELIVGVGDPSLNNTRELVRVAQEVKAKAVLAPLPFYFRLTPPMVYAYYRALDQITEIPVIIYDNPAPSGYVLSVDEIVRIDRDTRHVHHIKITEPRPEKVTEVLERTSMGVISGEDYVAWRMLKRGATAHIIAAPMLFPKEFREVCRLFAEGREEEAQGIFSRRMLPFMNDSLGGPDYIPALKVAMKEIGIFASEETKLPLLPLDEARRAEVVCSLNACLASSCS